MWLKIIQSKIWLYGFAGMVFALLQMLSLQSLSDLPLIILLTDSLVFTLWLIMLFIPLINVVRYGNLQSVLLPVRLFIYIVLGIFTLAVMLGGISGFEWLFFEKQIWGEMSRILPLKGVLALMAFMLILLYFSDQKRNDEEIIEDLRENEPGKETISVKSPSSLSENDHVTPPGTGIQERIAVKSGTKIHVVPVNEIVCLMADGDYVQVVTEKGKYLKEQTMKYFETHLPENQFVRIHRSCLVNVSFISRIELYEKQNQQLLLKNGDKVKISQAGYRLLREKLKL